MKWAQLWRSVSRSTWFGLFDIFWIYFPWALSAV